MSRSSTCWSAGSARRTGLNSTSVPRSMLKSSWAAPVGLSTQDRSRTGAAGGLEAPRTVQVAMPMAMKPAAMPRSSESSRVLARIVRARRRASAQGGRLAHQVRHRVGRPARSIATPPGWAVVRSRVPLGRSRCHSRVLRPPRSTRCRCQARPRLRHAPRAGPPGESPHASPRGPHPSARPARRSRGRHWGRSGPQGQGVGGSPMKANERHRPTPHGQTGGGQAAGTGRRIAIAATPITAATTAAPRPSTS